MGLANRTLKKQSGRAGDSLQKGTASGWWGDYGMPTIGQEASGIARISQGQCVNGRRIVTEAVRKHNHLVRRHPPSLN